MHSCPLEESVTTLSYLTRRTLRRDHFFPPVIIQANRESIVYRVVISRPRHPFDYLACPVRLPDLFGYKCECRANLVLEKSVEEILVELMAERVMSVGIQASSTGGLQASPSTGRHSSRTTEKRSKHRDDLANAKQIPSVLPDYIPPLAGVVNHDSIPRDFEYTLITAYIPKGIRVVGPQLGQIPALKNMTLTSETGRTMRCSCRIGI
jgi:hypothetical protein